MKKRERAKRSRFIRKKLPIEPSCSRSEKSRRRRWEKTLRPYLWQHTHRAYARPQYWAMTVPSGMPAKPRPGQVPAPKASSRLAPMLTALMIRSVHIESMEFCIPTNQPRRVISVIVAGAAQIRMKK